MRMNWRRTGVLIASGLTVLSCSSEGPAGPAVGEPDHVVLTPADPVLRAFGETIRDPRGLPTIYARQRGSHTMLSGAAQATAERVLARTSRAVSMCYGSPHLDGKSTTDSLGLLVDADA